MKHTATVIGLDIAKNVFYAVGRDALGREVLKRKMTREQVLEFFANLPAAKVGIEACAGAHYWARKLNELGHDTRLIAAQRVSRRVIGNKNDYRDAKVICELRGQPQTAYVPINTETQQDVQSLHRVRQRLVETRTAIMLQTRGLLGEYGLVFPQGPTALRRGLVAVLGGEHDEGPLEPARPPVHRHLTFLHGLEQRRLGLRRSAVDLVGEQEVREDRAGPELEVRLALVPDRGARDVRRKQVGRELDAGEVEAGGPGEGSCRHGLGEPWDVLQQDVAVGEDSE